MKSKEGALELSIGTIVIIVLAMSMLVLGIVLVRNIFTGSTDSVDELNEKVQSEIIKLFSDGNSDVIVKLGSDNTARIESGTGPFDVAIGARTLDGSRTDRERLKYKLSLDQNGDCVEKLGLRQTEELFVTPLNVMNNFDEFSGSNAFALIELNIPKGTAVCTQKVFIDVTDTQINEPVGGSFFKFEITKEGFF